MVLKKVSEFGNFVKMTWNEDLQFIALVTITLVYCSCYYSGHSWIFANDNCSLSNLVQNAFKLRMFQNGITHMTQFCPSIFALALA